MDLLNKLKLAVLLICTAGCTADLQFTDSSALEAPSPITWSECSQTVGDHPCDLVLEDQDANAWSLYENFGSIVVLDFSAEWCGYCQVGAGTLQSIQDEYAADDVIIVTVLVEDSTGNPGSPELAERWATYFGISAPVLAGSRDLMSADPAVGWPVAGFPSYFFIDQEMILRYVQPGYSDEGLKSMLDALISS